MFAQIPPDKMNGDAGGGGETGSATSVIRCVGVTKTFGRVHALSEVDLQVDRGDVFGFLGPNGAGKSTLVKILVGLVRADEGKALVLGGRPGASAIQGRVGYLPEHFRFPTWLTARELLRYHANLTGADTNQEWLLELAGLGRAGDQRIGAYSKGMQQRLGLAQALVGNPDVVFLDEPTSALDPLGRLEVRDLLHRLKEWGTTVFLNSHLLTEVERVCDQVAVIREGTIVAQGPLEELLTGPRARVRVGADDGSGRVENALRAARAALGADITYEDGVLSAVHAGADTVPTLVRIAAAAGLSVYEAGLERHSLEEIFVRLVSGTQAERTGVSAYAGR